MRRRFIPCVEPQSPQHMACMVAQKEARNDNNAMDQMDEISGDGEML
jgi:hypothetical protein